MQVLVVSLLVITLAGVAAVVYHLLVLIGRLQLRIEAIERALQKEGVEPQPESETLAEGTTAPDFELPLLSGGSLRLSGNPGRRTLLIFFNPSCSFCRALIEDIESLGPAFQPDRIAAWLVAAGGAEANRRFFEEHPVALPVLLDVDDNAWTRYRVNSTPTAYLIDESGRIAGDLIVGAESILRVLQGRTRKAKRGLAESRLVRDGLKAGARAPDFTLPSLDGTQRSLSDFRGRSVLLVFSDPDCRPCAELAPPLEKIHRESREVQVLMISRGELQTNRDKAARLGMTFPILLQRQWEISRAYGMFATPIAYRVDENGFLSAGVAVGQEQILGLARDHGRSGEVTQVAVSN